MLKGKILQCSGALTAGEPDGIWGLCSPWLLKVVHDVIFSLSTQLEEDCTFKAQQPLLSRSNTPEGVPQAADELVGHASHSSRASCWKREPQALPFRRRADPVEEIPRPARKAEKSSTQCTMSSTDWLPTLCAGHCNDLERLH